MALVVNTNVMSLTAQRNLSNVSDALNKSLERLSSGLRINRAADDAAGLAISEGLRSQVRGLNQAVRNANDGISILSTAEGALNETTSILQRVRELAVQAATDTNSTSNRASIQSEIDQQLSELTRMGNTIQFNGLKLLDGTFTGKSLQVGAFQNETISFSIEDMRATAIGKVASVETTRVTNSLNAGDVTLNGVSVGATAADGVSYLDSDASSIAVAAAINAVSAETDVTAEVNDTVMTAGKVQSSGRALATSSVSTGTGEFTFRVGGENGTSTTVALTNGMTLTQLRDAINATDANVTASIVNDGQGGGTPNHLVLNSDEGVEVTAEDSTLTFTNTGVQGIVLDGATNSLAINGVDIGAVTVMDNDSSDALVNKINSYKNQTGVTASMNENNQLELTATDGRNITVETTGSVGSNLGFTSGWEGSNTTNLAGSINNGTVRGTVSLYSQNSFSIGGSNVASAGLTAQSIAVDATTAVSSINVTTAASATSAIRTIDFALGQVSVQRSDIGATTNRLESMIRNLRTVSENLSASDSRIRDVDFASETANSTRSQILQQAGLAILAQANVQPQAALSLLGG